MSITSTNIFVMNTLLQFTGDMLSITYSPYVFGLEEVKLLNIAVS